MANGGSAANRQHETAHSAAGWSVNAGRGTPATAIRPFKRITAHTQRPEDRSQVDHAARCETCMQSYTPKRGSRGCVLCMWTQSPKLKFCSC